MLLPDCPFHVIRIIFRRSLANDSYINMSDKFVSFINNCKLEDKRYANNSWCILCKLICVDYWKKIRTNKQKNKQVAEQRTLAKMWGTETVELKTRSSWGLNKNWGKLSALAHEGQNDPSKTTTALCVCYQDRWIDGCIMCSAHRMQQILAVTSGAHRTGGQADKQTSRPTFGIQALTCNLQRN